MRDLGAAVLFVDGLGALLFFGLWVFCIFDVITTPESEVRNLPKLLWLVIVLLLPDLGSVIWLLAGRPWNRVRPVTRTTGYPEYERPGRATPANPDDDAEFLRQVRARAEEQRRRYQEQRRPDGDAG